MLSVVKSRWLMLNWDPGNAAARGREAFIRMGILPLPKDRISHCHCKDLMMKSKGAEMIG